MGSNQPSFCLTCVDTSLLLIATYRNTMKNNCFHVPHIHNRNMGVSIFMGVLQTCWFIMNNPIIMDHAWGYPHDLGNLHMQHRLKGQPIRRCRSWAADASCLAHRSSQALGPGGQNMERMEKNTTPNFILKQSKKKTLKEKKLYIMILNYSYLYIQIIRKVKTLNHSKAKFMVGQSPVAVCVEGLMFLSNTSV